MLKKTVARRFLYPVNLRLFYWAAHGLGILNSERELSGELVFLKQLSNFYKKDEFIAFDIGANVGNYSNMILENFGDCYVYCFEPHPETFQKLLANIGENKKVTLENFACSDTEEIVNIYGGGTGASLLESVHKNCDTNDKSEYDNNLVNTLILDKYINQNNINKINLLKIDTEGYELNVLESVVQTINKKMIEFVQFEFNSMQVYNKTFLNDMHRILNNYYFYRLLPNELLLLELDKKYVPFYHEIFAYQNIVCVRKDIEFFY